MPKYTVLAHRRVIKFLAELGEEAVKQRIKEAIGKLVDYPLSLRELDVEKLEGPERTFRHRIGRYRLIFGSVNLSAHVVGLHVNSSASTGRL